MTTEELLAVIGNGFRLMFDAQIKNKKTIDLIFSSNSLKETIKTSKSQNKPILLLVLRNREVDTLNLIT
jgi:hypothetical protein